jgi:hypothetical protein
MDGLRIQGHGICIFRNLRDVVETKKVAQGGLPIVCARESQIRR